jgi:hypothetical protein
MSLSMLAVQFPSRRQTPLNLYVGHIKNGLDPADALVQASVACCHLFLAWAERSWSASHVMATALSSNSHLIRRPAFMYNIRPSC